MQCRVLQALGGTIILLSVGTSQSESRAGDTIVVPMQEVSVFDLGRNKQEFRYGASSLIRDEPDPEIKAYPTLRSDKPIYGSVTLGDDQKAEPVRFVIDESRGPGAGYDRLYLDLDRDLDLTNGPPLGPDPRAPKDALLEFPSIKQQVCFEKVALAGDAARGILPVEILPRLCLETYDERSSTRMNFLRTTVRRGEFLIRGKKYEALLGHARAVRTRMDGRRTALFVIPSGQSRVYWWGGDRLSALHRLEGTLWGFTASPSGDELTVRPYDGDYGTFAVGAGGRDIEDLWVDGSFRAADKAVALEATSPGSSARFKECQLPVGDYLPTYINVRLGNLNLNISNNYHADGKPRDRGDLPAVYGIKIRKGETFTLDFSREPAVLFASPAKGYRLHPGDSLSVKAVLIDPELDIMIRGLDDMAPAKGERLRRGRSLDPKVIITRTNGEKVAEGIMPFG